MPASDNQSPTRPSALVISPEPPYPIDGGGPLRTASLLHFLAPRYDVDLIVFQHSGQEALKFLPAGLVRTARVIQLRHHDNGLTARAVRNGARMLRRRPPLVDRFSGYDAEISELLGNAPLHQPFDIAVLEHFWSASYLPLIRRVARRVILDLHNVESAWHGACAKAAGFPQSLIHYCFAQAARRSERQWLRLCDLILISSQNDARRVAAISPHVPVCVYPNAIPWRDPGRAESDFALAFSGNMEYEPNRIAVLWFTSQVWPMLKISFPALILRLIGKNAHAIAKHVKGLEGVECTGWVEDSFRHLEDARICIAPLRSGSGTRLKIIEAWAANRPVVSTRIGAEGLGAVDGESILLADSPLAFAEAIARLLAAPDLGQKIAKSGRELYERRFTWNVAWRSLDDGFNR